MEFLAFKRLAGGHARPRRPSSPRRRGRTSEALELHAEAECRWRAFGGVPGLAAALLGEARCLAALDRPGSEVPLAEAHRLFETMGDVVGMAESTKLLAQAKL